MAIPPTLRRKIRTRDKKQCRRCGGDGDGRPLGVHHILPDGPDELWNLMLLCEPCHGAQHDRVRIHHPAHPQQKYSQPTRYHNDKAWLETLYCARELSTAAIAARAGVAPMTAYEWLATHEIPMRSNTAHQDPADTRYREKHWLRDQYVEHGYSMNDIAAECGVGSSTIARWVHRYDLSR